MAAFEELDMEEKVKMLECKVNDLEEKVKMLEYKVGDLESVMLVRMMETMNARTRTMLDDHDKEAA